MPDDAERILSPRELNRAVLDRQLLLERSTDPVPAVLERMAGLQAQYAPAIYIGLWSRAHGVERDVVTALLHEREIVQGTLLRATIHVVSKRDYWPWALAIRDARRALLKNLRPTPSVAEVEKAAATLREAMRDGPVTQRQIDALIGSHLRRVVGFWVDMVRQPPSGTWEKRRADLYRLAEDWVGPPDATAEDGVALLVRRYLAGFGPAAPREIANWAGLPVATVAAALKTMETRAYRTTDGTRLVDLAEATIPPADAPAPVRFLPNWDASLLVHARRSGILPEEFRPRIFHIRAPQSFPVFLVDGQVAGTWKVEDGRLTYDEFRKLTAAERRRRDEEADRLLAFHT